MPAVWLERRGLPPEILAEIAPENVLSLPMLAGNRSLNLANAAAIAVYEAWRQTGPGLGLKRRSASRIRGAAAITSQLLTIPARAIVELRQPDAAVALHRVGENPV